MSDMNAIVLLRDLRASGMPESQAEVIASAIAAQRADGVAPRRDLVDFKSEIKRDLAERAETSRRNFGPLIARFNGPCDLFEARLDSSVSKLQTTILGSMFAVGVTIFVSTLTLVIGLDLPVVR
jgi:hypothetical protein